MKMAIDAKTEKRIRAAVKLCEPFALDDLIEEVCVEDDDLTFFSEIVGVIKSDGQ